MVVTALVHTWNDNLGNSLLKLDCVCVGNTHFLYRNQKLVQDFLACFTKNIIQG